MKESCNVGLAPVALSVGLLVGHLPSYRLAYGVAPVTTNHVRCENKQIPLLKAAS